jgi:hypothetical protein
MDDSVLAIQKKVINPCEEWAADSELVKLIDETLRPELVKSFREVELNKDRGSLRGCGEA